MRTLLYVSILLNLVLAACLLLRREGLPSDRPGLGMGSTTKAKPTGAVHHDAGKRPEWVVSDKKSQELLHGGSAPNGLDWRAIESSDYRVYVQRLRKAGVPEEIVRELVVADVCKAFAPRAHALLGTNPPPRYWQKPVYDPPLRGQLDQLRVLELEEQTMLTEILGASATIQSLVDRLYLQVDPREIALDFLPPETRAAAKRALDGAGVRHAEVNDPSLVEGEATPFGMDDVRKRLEILEGLLTPEEMETYRARISPGALNLAIRLKGIELTDREFVRLVGARLEAPSRENEDASTVPVAIVAGVLGEDRAAQYLKNLDNTYYYAREAARIYGLPTGVAEEVYALKQASEREAARIRQVAGPNQQTRNELQALRNRTERQMREKLGEPGFGLVSRVANWLQLLELPVTHTP